jgi:hypothetical protein
MSDQIPPDDPQDAELPIDARNDIVQHYAEQREKLGQRIDSKLAAGGIIAAEVDRTLITLAGGALIFSMTFVDKIAPAKLALWILFAAWLAFGVSMVIVMFAMRGHQRFLEKVVLEHSKLYKVLSEREKDALRNGRLYSISSAPVRHSRSVGILNLMAIITLALGMALLVGFVAYNVWHVAKPV